MYRVDVVIVVYNKAVDAIPSIRYLNSSDYVNRIIICDNSIKEMKNDEKCTRFTKVDYYKMPGNVGLSKAYNVGLEYCREEFINILDDDTLVPEDYYSKAAKYLRLDKAAVYLPLVYSRELLMSPCVKGRYRFRASSKKLLTKAKRISAINSGMIVNRRVYSRCKYDEELFLDMVDHKFMDDVVNNHFGITIMEDVKLHQNYSREIDNKDLQRQRFRISKTDNYRYYSYSIVAKLFCILQLYYWKVKLVLKYKDFALFFL